MRDKLEISGEQTGCGSVGETKEYTDWGDDVMLYPEVVTLVQEYAQIHGGVGAHYARLPGAKLWSANLTNCGYRLQVRQSDDRRSSGAWDAG